MRVCLEKCAAQGAVLKHRLVAVLFGILVSTLVKAVPAEGAPLECDLPKTVMTSSFAGIGIGAVASGFLAFWGERDERFAAFVTRGGILGGSLGATAAFIGSTSRRCFESLSSALKERVNVQFLQPMVWLGPSDKAVNSWTARDVGLGLKFHYLF